ncbi:MAG TPA: hypothetical protein VJV23_02695, partial [Candidatus Polarisedimenticolia bacterium]|nr:hypothetical protein [Candidatus Polarisedimenticolia bacterium]
PTPRWTWPKAAAALAAAALLVVAGAGIASLPWGGGEAGGEVERALADAEAARTGYAEAIARLEAEAGAVLGRASDPDLSPDRAAVLLAYRGRLAHLDAVIADVEGFLQANPGHSGGHMVLLAAYKEKTEVLREVLARRTGESSS